MQAVKAVAGVRAVYTRGGDSVTVWAVPASTNWTIEGTGGGGVRASDRSADWLILAADLMLNGEQVEPERGDVVTVAGVSFRVLPFGPQDALWSWVDRDGESFRRIHTRARA
jgi:hypothetical protein